MTNKPLSADDDEWRPAVGYEGLYEVSSTGQVRSLSRKTKSRYGLKTSPAKLLGGYVSNAGYRRVQVSKDGSGRHYSVHRLVAEAFIPNPAGKRCVNHLNLDKLDNRVVNLEWVTHQENTRHMIEKGAHNLPTGQKHPLGKLTQCKRGHPFDESNTYKYFYKDGVYKGRGCKKCRSFSDKAFKQRKRLAEWLGEREV